jgi:F-type H+-transporting ATPase subunit b
MKPHRWWLSLALSLPLLVTAGAVTHALAAEGGEQNPAEEPIGMVFRWLNFLLVFGAASYLIAKHAPAWGRRRADAIAASIAEAATAKAQAEQELREAEDRLNRLDQEVAELRAASQRESAAEAERIRAHTREEIKKIERAAQAEIEAAERAARMELKGMAARLAVERADALIRSQINPATQAALFRSFLADLARSVN